MISFAIFLLNILANGFSTILTPFSNRRIKTRKIKEIIQRF